MIWLIQRKVCQKVKLVSFNMLTFLLCLFLEEVLIVQVCVTDYLDELLEQASWSSPPDQSLSIYLAFQTSSRFYSKHSRYPGSLKDDLDGTKDVEEMFLLGKELLKDLDYKGGDELPESFSNSIKEL